METTTYYLCSMKDLYKSMDVKRMESANSRSLLNDSAASQMEIAWTFTAEILKIYLSEGVLLPEV